MTSLLCFRSFFALAIAALFFGLSPRPASAQTRAEAPVRLDIDIQGKDDRHVPSLKEAVDLLVARFREAGEPVNVIFKDEDGHSPMQPMKLQKVTFEQAMKALEIVVAPGAGVVFRNEHNLFVIMPDTDRDREAKRQQIPELRVFNVGEYLRRGAKAEDFKERFETLHSVIIQAIEFASARSAHVQKPEFEIDNSATLLFVSGPPETLKIVTAVLTALCYPHDPAPPAARP